MTRILALRCLRVSLLVTWLLVVSTVAANAQSAPEAAPVPALDPRTLVLAETDLPGSWTLMDEQRLRGGDQVLELYYEVQAHAPGRFVALGAARFADVGSAADSIDQAISQSRAVGQPGSVLDGLGDGPAVAFVYRVAQTDLRERLGLQPDALGETVMVRVDRYVVTVQVGGASEAFAEVDALAAELTEREVDRMRQAVAH